MQTDPQILCRYQYDPSIDWLIAYRQRKPTPSVSTSKIDWPPRFKAPYSVRSCSTKINCCHTNRDRMTP